MHQVASERFDRRGIARARKRRERHRLGREGRIEQNSRFHRLVLAGKALLGLALRGEDVPEDFLSSFVGKPSVGKLVTRDSVSLYKQQEQKARNFPRKVSFSSGNAAAVEEKPLQRKVSWSSQHKSIRLPAQQYVNDEENDGSTDTDEDVDDFPDESNFGAHVPKARSGSISKAARRSSLEIAKERKGSKTGLSDLQDSRRKSSFAKGDPRRKVSWNGSAQTRSILDVREMAGPEPEAPDVEGTIDEAARRSSLTLAKKRKSSIKAKQAELAKQGVLKVPGAEKVVEEGRLFALVDEADEDYMAYSFVFPDGSDSFMLYDPKYGPRSPTLEVALSQAHSVSPISHVEVEGTNANAFILQLVTQDGTTEIAELASPDAALISELHQRIQVVVGAKRSVPAKRGGMSVLFGSK